MKAAIARPKGPLGKFDSSLLMMRTKAASMVIKERSSAIRENTQEGEDSTGRKHETRETHEERDVRVG